MTNEALADFLPCPFCGSTAIVIGSRDGYHTQARCGFCFAAGPTHLEKAEATAAWNQRAGAIAALKQEAAPDVVELLEALAIARPYVANVVEADGNEFNRRDLARIDAALESGRS